MLNILFRGLVYKKIILSLTVISLFTSNAMSGMEKETISEIGAYVHVEDMNVKWAKSELKMNPHALHNACKKGDLEKVSLLIAHGADVNAKDQDDGWTPLHYAAWKGHTKVAKLLIDNVADVNAIDDLCSTPLHNAVCWNHVEVAKLLIVSGADVNAIDDDGWTSLHNASCRNYVEIAKLLVENGAKVNNGTELGWTPLLYSASGGHAEVTELLLDNGADINITLLGDPLLHFAANGGWTEVVRLLIAAGADVNARNSDGDTPLHFAAKAGHSKIVKLILSYLIRPQKKIVPTTFKNKEHTSEIWDLKSLGLMIIFNVIPNVTNADVIIKFFECCPSLLRKSKKILPYIDLNQDKIIQILLADENAAKELLRFYKQRKHFTYFKKAIATENDKNETALDQARKGNKVDCVKLLEVAENSYDIESLLYGIGGHEPIDNMQVMWARKKLEKKPHAIYKSCINGNLEKVKFLLVAGADPNFKTHSDHLLHSALYYRHAEVAKVLINHGAEVSAKKGDGHTPLHYACNGEVAELLIARGVEIDATDKDGSTPLHTTASFGCAEAVQVLIDNGAAVSIRNIFGITPLHFAENVDVAKLLIESGAQVNISGSPPLYFAAHRGRADLVSLLLANGAYVNVPTGYGSTPLHVAAENGYATIVKLLLKEATQGILSLKDLTFYFILKNLKNSDDQHQRAILDTFKLFHPELNGNLQDSLKGLISICRQKHFELLKKFIAMRDSDDDTALDVAKEHNNEDCVQLLQSAANAQVIDDLPNDLKNMIEESIKKMIMGS